MPRLLCGLLLGACQPLPPCQQELEAVGNELTAMISIDDPQHGEVVVSQVFIPPGLGRYPDGAPAVVYAHGGWSTNFVPLDEGLSHINPGLGIVQIYLNLPGGQGGSGWDSPGTNDRRGAQARQALAAALRYADDAVPDTDGCRLSQRLSAPLSGQIVLAGFSNGGNLAWATLADGDLDLPEVVGIATFETPSAGQFALVEAGTEDNASPVYVEGACDLEDGGLACDYDYDGLAFDASATDDAGLDSGVLFIDADQSGRLEAGEFRLGGVLFAERWHHSIQARQAADDRGLTLTDRASPTETAAFWQVREAPRQMAAAAARFPDLAGIAAGSEIDHVLTGAVDHPHVVGMITAMEEAGLAWHRLHPDSAYATLISRSPEDFPEHPANTAVTVDAPLPMLPNTPDGAHGEDYLTAAVVELMDRAHDGVWSLDLDTVLHR